MKNLLVPIVRKSFIEKIGRTAIECDHNGTLITVWANGNVSSSNELLCNITINEIGDKFIASSDSKTNDSAGKPIFKKGDTVTRQKQTAEFKSMGGNNSATQFAQGAKAFGLQLIVQMQ